MLVNLGTKRVKNNRIKVKTGSSCVYKESLIYSVYLFIHLFIYCMFYFMNLYDEYTVSCILRID